MWFNAFRFYFQAIPRAASNWVLGLGSRASKPYIQGQLPHLRGAVTWANYHGLKLIIDLHGVPGSQNGYGYVFLSRKCVKRARTMTSIGPDSRDYDAASITRDVEWLAQGGNRTRQTSAVPTDFFD